MDKNLKKIIGISVLVLVLGGIPALIAMWEVVWQIVVAFFPIFCQVGKIALEEYLTSPYFIVSVIMSIASGFGIWFGVKGGKALFLIVSIVCELLSLASILSNVL